MADEELKKKIIDVPNLPNIVQGDGRYLMTLLNDFLKSMATQVNLANGFSAEEINPEIGKYPTPRDFFLTFNRTGGVLTWSHLADVNNLAYYELRTDTNVGKNAGLLERTVNNTSVVLPLNYVATIYLYAVSKDKEVSAPSELSYTKARPNAPTDIAITPNSEGNLITFMDIPSNCIGANIYIGGEVFKTLSNVFLYKYTGEIDQIEVAYYDQFGEGERGILYLVLPDITGLLVERNGAELDFYWDAVNVYGVYYVVKVCSEPDWSKAIELFRTKTNDKNRYIYPNTGQYYLLVKAVDEHGNYSRNAAYQLMNTIADIHRNMILSIDEKKSMFAANKINLYYNAPVGGITLEREKLRGEYIFDVKLPKKYRARNWLEVETTLFTSENNVIWDDALFFWDNATQPWGGIIGNSDGIGVKYELSPYEGAKTNDLFAARLNGTLTTADNKEPIIAVKANDFRSGRWTKGLYIGPSTKLKYNFANISGSFTLKFNLRITSSLPTTVLCTLVGQNGSYMRLEYAENGNKLKLVSSDGNNLELECFVEWGLSSTGKTTFRDSVYPWRNSLATWGRPQLYGAISDWLTFAISQTDTKRTLFIHSYNEQKCLHTTIDAKPIGNFNGIYCYPEFEI